MTDDSYRRQVSPKHMELLVQFMERLRPLALATDRSREGLARSRWMWEKIAVRLNKVDENMAKTGKHWARYWIDLKFRLRRKYAIIKRCEREGKSCLLRLTPFEGRLVKILTDSQGNLLGCSTVHDRALALMVRTGEHWKQDEHSHIDSSSNDGSENNVIMPTEHINIDEEKIEPDGNTSEKDEEAMKKEFSEFQLKKEKELFEIDKKQRYERHKIEIDILNLRKKILEAQLLKLQEIKD